MNRKMILVPLIVILLLVAVTPAFAAPTNGRKIAAEQYPGSTITAPTVCPRDGVTYPYTGTYWFNDQGVVQRRDYGQVLAFTFVVHYATGDVTLKGLSFNNYDRLWKFAVYDPSKPLAQQVQTGSDAVYHYDAIWWFPTVNGGFEGNINLQIKDYAGPDMNIKTNCVLQGYGYFEGQTLQLSLNGPVNVVWTGYLNP
jgi:hypothetical protein